MKHKNQPFLLLLLLTLAACGGGGGGGDGAETDSRVTAESVAGPAEESASHENVAARGCVDGTAPDILLGDRASLAVSSDGGTVYTAEQGACDFLFRLRKLDLAGKTVSTLATGQALPAGDAADPVQLQSFLTPTSIAQAADGTLFIADSEVFTGGLTLTKRDRPGLGNGIWALLPSGQLRQVAGFGRPSSAKMADGKGPLAVFESITQVCAGKEGEILVLDMNQVRSIAADGDVTTLTSAGGGRFSELYCGREGNNLLASRGGDGERTLYATLTQQSFATKLQPNSRVFAMNDGLSAWAAPSGSSALALMGLKDGRTLPGSEVTISSGQQVRVGGKLYTLRLEKMRSAGSGVVFVPTTYGVVKLIYR